MVFVEEQTIGKSPVSIEIRDVPLDQALRTLLKGFDVFFYYHAPASGGASALEAVWIYPRDHGQGLEPVPPEKWASTIELKGRLTSSDPAARAQAIEALAGRDRNGAADAVLQALGDSDEQVRTRALYAAESQGIALPSETLLTLTQSDPSATVRFLALGGLEGHPEASTAARAALQDPSPFVRNKAREMMSALEPAPQSLHT
jgi:HEAT repeat protein